MDSSCWRCGGRGGLAPAPNRQATSPPRRHHSQERHALHAAPHSQASARVLYRPVYPAALVQMPRVSSRQPADRPGGTAIGLPRQRRSGPIGIQLPEKPQQKFVQKPALVGPAISSVQITPLRTVCFFLVSPTLARVLRRVNDRQYTICIVFVHSLRLGFRFAET